MPQIIESPARLLHRAHTLMTKMLRGCDGALDAILGTVPGSAAPPPTTHIPNQPQPWQVPQMGFRQDTLWAIPGMWWEMAAGAAGATAFLAGLASRRPAALVVGWGLGAIGKGIPLWLDLGRPERAWRVFAKARTSWISRGALAYSVFAVAGAGTVICAVRPPRGPLGASSRAVLAGTAGTAATVLGCYDGLFLNASAGVDAWQPRTLPLLLTAQATVAGCTLAAALPRGRGDDHPLAHAMTTALAGSVTFLTAAAHRATLASGTEAARRAASELTTGEAGRDLRAGALWLGTAVPMMLSAAVAVNGRRPGPRGRGATMLDGALRVGAAASALIGTVALRRAVLRTGSHAPLVAHNDAGEMRDE